MHHIVIGFEDAFGKGKHKSGSAFIHSSVAEKRKHMGVVVVSLYMSEEITVDAYWIVLRSSFLRLQAIFFALFVQNRFSFSLEFFSASLELSSNSWYITQQKSSF